MSLIQANLVKKMLEFSKSFSDLKLNDIEIGLVCSILFTSLTGKPHLLINYELFIPSTLINLLYLTILDSNQAQIINYAFQTKQQIVQLNQELVEALQFEIRNRKPMQTNESGSVKSMLQHHQSAGANEKLYKQICEHLDELHVIGNIHNHQLKYYRTNKSKVKLPNLLAEIYEIENGAPPPVSSNLQTSTPSNQATANIVPPSPSNATMLQQQQQQQTNQPNVMNVNPNQITILSAPPPQQQQQQQQSKHQINQMNTVIAVSQSPNGAASNDLNGSQYMSRTGGPLTPATTPTNSTTNGIVINMTANGQYQSPMHHHQYHQQHSQSQQQQQQQQPSQQIVLTSSQHQQHMKQVQQPQQLQQVHMIGQHVVKQYQLTEQPVMLAQNQASSQFSNQYQIIQVTGQPSQQAYNQSQAYADQYCNAASKGVYAQQQQQTQQQMGATYHRATAQQIQQLSGQSPQQQSKPQPQQLMIIQSNQTI